MKTGVYPVYKNQFKVGATKETATAIKDMESFSVAFENGVEEWKPMDQEGWTRRLMTAKSMTVSIAGKRNVGDPGNDFVANKAFANGSEAEGVLVWTFPDGTEVDIPCVISVTNTGSGDSTGVGPLEFECMSNGKPSVTGPASPQGE